MTGDAAVGKGITATEQIRGLYLCEGERLEPVCFPIAFDHTVRLQRFEDLLAILRDQLLTFGVEDTFRGTEPDLALFYPQAYPAVGQIVDDVGDAHSTPLS